MRQVIDLNCDLGEGMDADDALLELVSSANIACGGHAGDQQTMVACVRKAKALGVALGAHPGYSDRANFGRLPHSLSAAAMRQLYLGQVATLNDVATQFGARITHLRAHGALGNLSDADHEAASVLAQTVAESFPELAIMTLGGSAAEKAAKSRGLPVIRQFFADRAYDIEGQLVSRKQANSVLHDTDQIIHRLLSALDTGKLETIDGQTIDISFDSVCVHGDTPGALALAEAIRKCLDDGGLSVQPYPQWLKLR